MTGRILPIEKFVFPDFTLSHFESLVETGPLADASFVAVEDWEPLPPGIRPMTPIHGQDSGNKYGVLKGLAHGYPTQFYLGVQNLHTRQKFSDVDFWQYPEAGNGWHNSAARVNAYTPAYFLYVEVILPYRVPHMRVHPRPNYRELTTGTNVKLEGNFNETFTVETSEGYEVQAFEILHPDTMVQLLDVIPAIGLEFVGDKLYFRLPLKHPWRVNGDVLKFNKTWNATMAELFAVIASIPELVDSAKTAAVVGDDPPLIEQAWNSTVAPEESARKVKTLVTTAGIIILGGGGLICFFVFSHMFSVLSR